MRFPDPHARIAQKWFGRGATLTADASLKPYRAFNADGCNLIPQVRMFGLYLCLILFLGVSTSRAQAPIDPSLPETPLSHERAILLFPGYDVMQQTTEPVAPLRPAQKLELAYRSIFDPSLLIRSSIVTVYDKSLSVGPDYGRGAGGIAQLFGYNCTSLASTFFFSDAFVPIVFHQDPRYFRKGSGSAKTRILWALRSEFVAFSDKGRPMPNYGSVVGYGLSTLLSDAYLPARNVSVGKTLQGYGIKFGANFGFNIFHEFDAMARVKKVLQQQTAKMLTRTTNSEP